MKQYSHFFSTLHDEERPVGRLGRGTHYSVLRAVVWVPDARFHDFAVIWDEDHDTRIVWVLEQLHVRRLLSAVLAIGERKGGVTVLTEAEPREDYRQQIEAVTTSLPSDSFGSEVECFTVTSGSIISDSTERVRAYLDGIRALWRLGTKEPEFNTSPF